jgi:pimeloyl-ACP methyl ester carboxylesterase
VEWDQRGSGKTYGLNEPDKVAPTLHKERMIEDTEELIAYLRLTYVKKKIFVMGHPWGTILGLSVAERRPEWLYAYIGAGQIINMQEGERIGYKFVLDTARKAGDVQALDELTAIAPYPEFNEDLPLDKIDVEGKWSVRYGGLTRPKKL